MDKSMSSLFLLLFLPISANAQKADQGSCVLSQAAEGQVVTVSGKVLNEPHDMGFEIPGCNEIVLLTYAGEQDSDVSANKLRKNSKLRRFRNYTSAVHKSSSTDSCVECLKYGDVEATLTGTLEIATMSAGATKDSAGFVHDSSGRVVGKFGWGHPVPFAKYRLVIQSVSEVKARKLPKPETKPTATTSEPRVR